MEDAGCTEGGLGGMVEGRSKDEVIRPGECQDLRTKVR
jgi:hypothetical protein